MTSINPPNGGETPAADLTQQVVDENTVNEKTEPQTSDLSAPEHPFSNSDSDTTKEKEKDSSDAENGEKKEDQERKGGLKDYARIFRFCDPQDWILYSIAIGCAVGAGSALPLMTIVFGGFTERFNDFTLGRSTPQAFRNDVDNFVLWFIYLFVGRFVLVYVGTVSVSIAAMRTTRNVRKAFLQSSLRQEVYYFDQAGTGSTASQVTTNGNRINNGIAEKLTGSAQAIALFFSAFIVALAIQWKLALITMSIIPAVFAISSAAIMVDAPIEARIVKLYSEASSLAQEAISSIKTVHAFWAQDKLVSKYDEYLDLAHAQGKKKAPIYGVLFSTEYFCVYSGAALSFWQGYRMYNSREIESVGTVLTVVLSVTIGATAMSQFLPNIISITEASSAAGELFSVIDRKSQLDPLAPGGFQPDSCHGDIKIRNLSFAYPSRPAAPVLKQLNLDIPAGKTTALVGASGCGKSTLVGLLERWYKPAEGSQILLDGKDISEYNTKWLRSTIRLVQQEPVLFTGTVFDNIAKGFVGSQADLPREKQLELIKEACILSNAHGFITDLPQGYDTEVGERASMLSGGQRQRVAIARSIIGDPKVLLLDEATSALDPQAEGIVQDALSKVSVNKTTLIIAHKLATVKAADNIVVMSEGLVMEQGTHHELIEKDGSYAALVRAQDLGDTGDKDNSEERKQRQMEGEAREEPLALQRTQTQGAKDLDIQQVEYLTAGTLNYGLLRCIFIMFKEQKVLYWRFAISAVGCLIGGGTYPAQALLYSQLINVFTLTGAEGQSRANFFALMFFVVAIANWIGYFTIGWHCNMIGQYVTHRYRREMLSQVLHLDQDFFDLPANSSGAIASKLSSVPNALLELISANIMLMFIVFINAVSSSILAIAFGWKLGLVVVFGGLPLLLGAGVVKIRVDQRLEKQAGERFAESAGVATEAVISIRTVASLTLENQVCDQYNAVLDVIVQRAMRSIFFTMIGYALSQSLEFLIMALGFWYGSRLIASGEYSVTQFFTIFIAVVFGGTAAGQFFGYSTAISKAKIAANYVLWLRTLKSKIGEDEANQDKGPEGDGDIGVEDLEFRYKQRGAARVLKGINLDIPVGTFAACVGPSGCGKTTLISLLERFYDPTGGQLTHGSTPITQYSPRLYREHMSLVQQEPTLYQGTVRDNIALGLATPPSDDVLLAAARDANAADFIASLPEGLNTRCGTRGLQFSGGQRQRLAIARALVRSPRLLLLDEATSALDTQSERVVQSALDRAAKDGRRTTVAVAHRLSTIKHADVIFVFSAGRIVECGTHKELMELRGSYWQMCLAQSLDQA